MFTFKEYLIEANLSKRELYKYDWRVEMFINKMQSGEEFELNDGTKVKLVTDRAIIRQLQNREDINKAVLQTTTGDSIKFSDLKKTKDFGGVGSTTAKEDKELESLINQIEAVKAATGLPYILVRAAGKTHRVATAETTFGTPKSDFHLLDEKGREVVWISHKDGKKAGDFQQWGGMTEKEIVNHPEIQDFVATIQEMYGEDGIPRATTVARKIRSDKLRKQTVYGVNYGGPLGRQNVSLVLQGPVKLVKRGRVFEIEATYTHHNGENMSGNFIPVLMAIYKGDRSNFGVKGARFAIQPLGSRKVKEWV